MRIEEIPLINAGIGPIFHDILNKITVHTDTSMETHFYSTR